MNSHKSTCVSFLTDFLKKLHDGTVPVTISPTSLQFDDLRSGHFHGRAEVFIQIEGESTLLYSDREVVIPPYGLHVIQPYTLHESRASCDGNDFSTFLCRSTPAGLVLQLVSTTFTDCRRAKRIKGFFAGAWNITLPPVLDGRISSFLNHFLTPVPTDTVFSKLNQTALLISYFSQIGMALSDHTCKETQLSLFTRTCLNEIDQNYRRADLDLAWLAAECGCSPNHLSMLFHHEVGVKFSDYLKRIRLDLAKSLLEKSTLSIMDVAYSCGFNSASYFTKVFTQAYGTSPRNWRTR